MKKHYLKKMIALVISMIILLTDIAVLAANNEETIGEINQEQNLEYATYWDNPNFSNLVVFVGISEPDNDEDIAEIKEELDKVRDHFNSFSEGKLMIENIVPQYDVSNDEISLLILENSCEYYIEDEAKLIDEVAEYLNESAIISDTINLHYSSDENVVDNLTIVVLGENVNEVFASHVGAYKGDANVKEHSIHDYILFTEYDFVDLEQGNAFEIMSELLGVTNLEAYSEQIEEETSTTTEIIYEDTEEEKLDSISLVNTGWYQLDGNWYYTQDDGNDAVGITEIEEKKYYFDDAGCLRNGWQKIDDIRYFFAVESIPQDCYLLCEVLPQEGWVEMTNGDRCYARSGGSVVAGWYTINDQNYYFDSYGILQKGWLYLDDKWYYADEKGKIAEGIVEIEGKKYYFDTEEGLRSGWQKLEEIRYFFAVESTPQECYLLCEVLPKEGWVEMSNGDRCYARSGGSVVAGWYTIDGHRYYFDSYGILQTGWLKEENNWYYTDASGEAAEGMEEIDGQKYYFDSVTGLKNGWVKIGTIRYFFAVETNPQDCYLLCEVLPQEGWVEMSNGDRCYARSGGSVVAGWYTIDGHRYYFDSYGILQTGWLKEEHNWYYTDASGEAVEGLEEIDGQKYYFDSVTGLKSGWVKIGTIRYFFAVETNPQDCYLLCEVLPQEGWVEMSNGDRCYARSGGSVVAGWYTIDGQKYYFDSYGILQTGWIKVGGNWYFADASGQVVIGFTELDDKTYYFDSVNGLQTGWLKLGMMRYFFAVDTNPQNCYLLCEVPPQEGWIEMSNGDKCYARTGGSVVAGWYTVDGCQYYFNSYGIMQIGWQTINGTKYFFDRNGVYIPMSSPEFISVLSENDDSIDITWEKVPGVKGYILEYSKDSSFNKNGTTMVAINGDNVNDYHLDSLKYGEKYYFRLKYIVYGGTTAAPEDIYSQYSVVKSVVVGKEVEATATSAKLTECKIVSGNKDKGITLHLQAQLADRVKSVDNKYYIVETESYGNSIDFVVPGGSVDKVLELDTTIRITDVDRALMNKFAIAILNEKGSYQLISEPMGITNPEAVADNTAPILKPTSKKGLQGIGYDAALDTNSKNTLFNLDLATVVGTGPASGYEAFTYKGKTYYFSKCSNLVAEFEKLNDGIMQYAQGITGKNNKVCVTLNLLLSYKDSNAYLIDPAARTSGHKYYTLNVREEKARETYEALFLYLGELFGQSDCYVTNWVLGNEVNSSRAWNYQGSLSFSAYMQSYATAFRLLYTGVKASKTGNNVYISLDNGWTAAPDTYAGKTTLDSFALYAQKENPDMLWSIAYHGYSYPLTRVDFWNDNTYTTSSTSTKYISMKNVAVLTNYAATLEQKYEKPQGSIRVIFSEQGYTAAGSTDATAEAQARALARGYYMAEFNDRVDAFIIRAINDDTEEMKGGLYLGLKTYNDIKRITFYTYEFMDSSLDGFGKRTPDSIASSATNQNKVSVAQNILCKTDWASIIPGFSKSKLAGMY